MTQDASDGGDAPPLVDVAGLTAMAGRPVGRSRWLAVDQGMIDRFADLTGDHQFIHVDPRRARETPFGGTIAHGFLTLSLMGGLATGIMPRVAGERMGVNYGFDRLRFVAPVRSGRRVRTVLTLRAVDAARPDHVELLYDAVLEVEGEEKPAIVAEWRTRSYLEPARPGPGPAPRYAG